MLTPAVQASVDQIAALVRDAYQQLGMDLDDPHTRATIRATWMIVAANQPSLPWILSAIDQAIGDG